MQGCSYSTNRSLTFREKINRLLLPQLIRILNVCQGGRNRFPYRVNSAHKINDVTEQWDDDLQLVAGLLRVRNNVLQVADDAGKKYFKSVRLFLRDESGRLTQKAFQLLRRR